MEVRRITLAVTDMSTMVTFYNNVFGSALVERGLFAVGDFAGMPLLLCPNEIAEVDARQNRHQFRLGVFDIDDVLARVVAYGGHIVNDDREGTDRVVGVSDPDGNTYELVAAD
jgi:predicted enzyme related to lactoylglutathione lyase